MLARTATATRPNRLGAFHESARSLRVLKWIVLPLVIAHVLLATISGYRASSRTAPYAAVKAAVINYTMSQALMLAPKKIRVNAIAPGSIEFPGGIWDERKKSNPQLYNAILGSIPWGRLGAPGEIANAALFLCSDAASWVTGQTLSVDGGQTLS